MSEVVQHWLDEIEACRKREGTYRKVGRRVRETYAGEHGDTTPFNVLFSNTETMLPSLYSNVPRPVVQRRYKDDDPAGKAAALAAQRLLEFLVDTNIEGYDTFHVAVKSAVHDALLSGRGVTAVKYDAETYGDELRRELVCTETVSWDRVYFGYARKWSKVPWVAFEWHIDEAEAKRLFGEKASRMTFMEGEQSDDAQQKAEAKQDTGRRKTALVYQIWDKDGGRKIRYISPHFLDGYLREDDDPLGLTGFFNIPEPLMFVSKTHDLVPTSLYTLYENQAKELNHLTVRINRLIKAIKARGIYDSNLGGDIENLMDADENALVPSERGASFAAEKGLQNAIWFMPLDVLIQTLRELYVAREQCKQVIYEIMGISDILRGSSRASETLGAQKIKETWGTLRLKPKQNEVQRYCRDLLRMMVEIAAQRFNEETWAQMTGLPFMTSVQFDQAMQVAQQAAMAGDVAPMEQLKGAVTWPQVLELLRSDLQRAYRIDIETNSTVEPEAVEDQKNITELMTAIGQFLNGVGPLVQRGAMPFEAAQSMLLAITRRFRFGTEIEDYVRNMRPPQPEGDNGESRAQSVELSAKQREMQLQSENMQMRLQVQKLQAEQEIEKKRLELAVKELELKKAEEQFRLEQKAAQDAIQTKASVENVKLDSKKQLAAIETKSAQKEREISKQLDLRITESVKNVKMLVDQMVQMQNELAKTVIEQAKRLEQVEKWVRSPRRRRAIRDQNGRIVEAVEELIQ